MRTTTRSIALRTAFLALFLALLAEHVQAQCFTFSSNLAEYDNYSFDGTYVYTSSELSGGVSMNIQSYCAPYLPNFNHTAEAYNQIHGSDGSNLGGWAYASPTCEDCYLEEVNRQQFVPQPGVAYDVTFSSEAYCSGGGAFFGNPYDQFEVLLSGTTGALIGQDFDPQDGQPRGIYEGACYQSAQICPQGNADWRVEFPEGTIPWTFVYTPFLSAWSVNGSIKTLFGCIQPPISLHVNGSGPCS